MSAALHAWLGEGVLSPAPPLGVGVTMEAQADALAALPGALDISRTAIVTGSGGGLSTVLFALRHPDRYWKMVLVSAMTRLAGTRVTAGQKALRVLFKSDFFIWCVPTLLWLQLVEYGMGRLSDCIRADAQTMADLKSLIHRLILNSPSKNGMANDWVQWKRLPIYPLEQIKTHTLIIRARNDKTMPHRVAKLSTTIPARS